MRRAASHPVDQRAQVVQEGFETGSKWEEAPRLRQRPLPPTRHPQLLQPRLVPLEVGLLRRPSGSLRLQPGLPAQRRLLRPDPAGHRLGAEVLSLALQGARHRQGEGGRDHGGRPHDLVSRGSFQWQRLLRILELDSIGHLVRQNQARLRRSGSQRGQPRLLYQVHLREPLRSLPGSVRLRWRRWMAYQATIPAARLFE